MAITYSGGLTITGGITQTVLGVGGSTSYNGSNQYLTTSYAVNWSTLGSLTLESWLYFSSIAGTNLAFVSTGGVGAGTGYTNFYIYGSGGQYPGAIAVGINGVNEIRSSNGVIAAGQWYHVAYTFNGTTTVIYVNGVAVATSTTSVYSNNSSNLIIGQGLGTTYMNGYISNVRLVKGVVVYTAAFTPPTSPLTSLQSANVNGYPSAAITGTSTSLLLNMPNNSSYLNDSSTNGFTVTNAGSVPSTSLTPFNPGSILFNGTTQVLTIPDNAAFEMTGDFTLEAWFYMTATTIDQEDIITKGATGQYQPYSVYVNSSNAVTLKASSNGSSWNVANSVTFGTITLNTWNHVAVSRIGTGMSLFLNGALNATVTNGSALYNNTYPVGIGGRSDATELFTGYISNVRIVKGVGVYSPTGSVLFNGSKYLTTPASSANDFGTGDFTIEMWINPTQAPLSTPVASTNQMFYGYRSGTDSALQIYWNYTQGVSVGGDLTNWISSSVGLQLNVWSHIAVVRSGTIMILYINGVPVGTATNSTNLNNSANVRYIGGMNGTNLYGTFGYISNLRVVKGTAVYGPPSGTGSVSLNGSSQYLTVASNAAFAFGTGDFTTEFWFNVSGAGDSADQHVFQTRDGTNNGILFQYNRTNKTLAFLSDTGLTGLITANNAIVDGTWYHVSATRSGTAIYFFVNGILIASTTSAQNFSGTTPYIGRRYATDGFLHYFNGNISNLRVVKGVAVYTGNFTPSTVPLTSTQLANVNGYPSAAITGTSTSLLLNTVYGAGFLTDSSSYNFTVTNVGTATSQSLTPFVGNFIPPTRQLTSTQLANVNGYPSAEITGTSTSLLLNTPNNSSFLTDSSSYNFTVTNVGTATSQATAPFALSFTPSTVPLQSTQSANQIGNPSAAITGTSTSLLLNTQNGPAYLVDGSTNNFTVTNTGGATKQSSIPFSL